MWIPIRERSLILLIVASALTLPVIAQGEPQEGTDSRELTIQGFTFSLKKCALLEKRISCHLTVVSNDQDRDLTIRSDSRMFDDSGNEYAASRLEIANKKSTRGLSSLFISGVPTTVRLHFENTSTQTRAISLLQIQSASAGYFKVDFRDIPIVR